MEYAFIVLDLHPFLVLGPGSKGILWVIICFGFESRHVRCPDISIHKQAGTEKLFPFWSQEKGGYLALFT